MSFELILKGDAKKDINGNLYKKNFKDRPHVSKSKIDMYSNSVYIGVGKSHTLRYSGALDTRYMAATDMTFDMLISLYDINSRTLLVHRFYMYDGSIKKGMLSMVSSLKAHRPNIEARVIGRQNSQESYVALEGIADFFISNKIKLVEADIFGNSIRHVAIDAKLGTSYNILMEDRLYRPGELISSMTLENFEAKLAGGPDKAEAAKKDPA
ncbi:MAG: hypothetical protein ACREBH_01450 [Candidatus Micrarchaeaceae archaeon]